MANNRYWQCSLALSIYFLFLCQLHLFLPCVISQYPCWNSNCHYTEIAAAQTSIFVDICLGQAHYILRLNSMNQTSYVQIQASRIRIQAPWIRIQLNPNRVQKALNPDSIRIRIRIRTSLNQNQSLIESSYRKIPNKGALSIRAHPLLSDPLSWDQELSNGIWHAYIEENMGCHIPLESSRPLLFK